MALALGFAHPDELLKHLNARQIAEWEVYYSLEPWGWWETWKRFAMVAASIVNVFRKKGTSVVTIETFMPTDLDKERERLESIDGDQDKVAERIRSMIAPKPKRSKDESHG